MAKKIKDIGELALIAYIAECFKEKVEDKDSDESKKIITSIGDDAAVVDPSQYQGNYQLITTDILIQDQHFSFNFINPYLLGRKSVLINISDIAAMGGTPELLLLSLGLNPNFLFDDFKELLRGINDVCDEYNIKLIGGDTVGSKKLVVNIALFGYRKKSYDLPLRKNAKVGDNIYVTGFLGDSGLGLKILNDNPILFGEDRNYLVQRHLSPSPRLKESILLSEKLERFSLIDISDGLFSELNHISQQSDVTMQIKLDKIPISKQLKNICEKLQLNPYEFALFGGEDYELLFTCDKDQDTIKRMFKKHPLVQVTMIGKVVSKGHKVVFFDRDNKEVKYKDKRYNHFS